MFPITHICVEDIKARTIERAKKWNQCFSPLEVGKHWFYAEIQKRWELVMAIAIAVLADMEKNKARVAAVILWVISILPEVVFAT